MTIEKKLLGTSPSGGAVNVADVFSTYLYTGTETARPIVNGIDLANEGGLVWIKGRSGADHRNGLFDTERGRASLLFSDGTEAAATSSATWGVTAFNDDGWGLGVSGNIDVNSVGETFSSWTFRKAPKFFDVVTYTGTGVNRTIAHSLGGAVGFMAVKRLDGLGAFTTFHKSLGGTKFMEMHSTYQEQASGNVWNNTAPTDAVFTVGVDSAVNTNGSTYVAYLFADNTDEDADNQMIKCGSYTGDGTTDGSNKISLGWEPQYVMIKASSGTSNWYLLDTMRGIVTGGADNALYANLSNAEAATTLGSVEADGFSVDTGGTGNASGVTYIYMAIRAPMMVEPESGTEVFKAYDNVGNGSFYVGFPPDFSIQAKRVGNGLNATVGDRLRGSTKFLSTSLTSADDVGIDWQFDLQNTFQSTWTLGTINWLFKRAKGFFDVVAYTGDGVQGRTVPHSVGVAPEMIWFKLRDQQAYKWAVYHKDISINDYLILNTDAAVTTNTAIFDSTAPTDAVFSTGDTGYFNNGNTKGYIAYLFASVSGVSKVGSYTGNGSSQTLNCGFAAGARFILIKRTDATGDWYVWDTARGIVAGNDPHLSLNTTAAEVSDDSIDPDSSGFSVNQISATNINVSSGTYIYLAIA